MGLGVTLVESAITACYSERQGSGVTVTTACQRANEARVKDQTLLNTFFFLKYEQWRRR